MRFVLYLLPLHYLMVKSLVFARFAFPKATQRYKAFFSAFIITNSVSAATVVDQMETAPMTTRQTVIRATNKALASNKILETIRKADQLEIDDRFSTETNSVFLLLPIVEFEDGLNNAVTRLGKDKSDETLTSIRSFLFQSKYDTKNLKKLFNRYSDNIYYTEPEKANIYLAGGAVPDSQQTQRYLLRNDILTYMDNVKEDFKALKADVDFQTIADSEDDMRELQEALQAYLQSINQEDLVTARKVLGS